MRDGILIVQRNRETSNKKGVLAGRSEVKEQERRRVMNENRGMRCAGLDNSTKETDKEREVSPKGHDYSRQRCD